MTANAFKQTRNEVRRKQEFQRPEFGILFYLALYAYFICIVGILFTLPPPYFPRGNFNFISFYSIWGASRQDCLGAEQQVRRRGIRLLQHQQVQKNKRNNAHTPPTTI